MSVSQNFIFNLQDNCGDAVITTSFGCKTSGGISTLVFTANGNQLGATTADRINFTAAGLIDMTKTTKQITTPGERLDLNIRFNASGTVSKAALDYIEVEYPRKLSLVNNELHFYVNPDEKSLISMDNATPATMIWDITNPLHPVEMSGDLQNGSISFEIEKGYHEFIAFNTDFQTRVITGGEHVDNQDIHGMIAPDLLVISPKEFLTAASRFSEIHAKTDGLSVLVLTPESIYNEFSSGKPDVSAFRKLLKMWYDKSGKSEANFTRHCLLMGRPTYDNKMVSAVVRNAGYPRIPIWQSYDGYSESTSYSTDDYIGMLEDVDGEFNISTAKIIVAVGRFPVKNLSEANAMLDKIENYYSNPEMGAWRNQVMVIADDQDYGVHLEQAEAVISKMREKEDGKDLQYEKLYLDSYQMEYTSVGASYPAAHEHLLNKISEGVSFINYIGHANPTSWGHEFLLTWNDIINMKNKRLPFVYASTCEFLRWDDDEVSGAEKMWTLPNSGVIGMICPSREVQISSNGSLNSATAQFYFEKDENGKPLSLGQIMVKGKNASNTGNQKLRYGFLGDPSMKMPWPDLKVAVDSIAGIDLDSDEESPVIKARENVTIKGHIVDGGKLSENFNGIVELNLYDAEKVVTTNGNGETGVESVYNDRNTRLFTGRTKVISGEWQITFSTPAEIENNFSTALLSLYAYDNNREANGSNEQFYVYGYDEDAPEDFEGPSIHEFYLNSPAFKSGQDVGPSPSLYISMSDDSGINVSEAGIGHGITLELDGTRFFDDISQYFIPDEEDPKSGKITYPLSDITEGHHTLKFMVWDNANNSSSSEIEFNIPALWHPNIETLSTDMNPATSSVNFIVATDGATDATGCNIEVFDINGRKVWSSVTPSLLGNNNKVTLPWNLCDYSGQRTSPGLYLYRATVTTDKGVQTTKTKKLIISGR